MSFTKNLDQTILTKKLTTGETIEQHKQAVWEQQKALRMAQTEVRRAQAKMDEIWQEPSLTDNRALQELAECIISEESDRDLTDDEFGDLIVELEFIFDQSYPTPPQK